MMNAPGQCCMEHREQPAWSIVGARLRISVVSPSARAPGAHPWCWCLSVLARHLRAMRTMMVMSWLGRRVATPARSPQQASPPVSLKARRHPPLLCHVPRLPPGLFCVFGRVWCVRSCLRGRGSAAAARCCCSYCYHCYYYSWPPCPARTHYARKDSPGAAGGRVCRGGVSAAGVSSSSCCGRGASASSAAGSVRLSAAAAPARPAVATAPPPRAARPAAAGPVSADRCRGMNGRKRANVYDLVLRLCSPIIVGLKTAMESMAMRYRQEKNYAYKVWSYEVHVFIAFVPIEVVFLYQLCGP